jgi:hypothetical protein
MQHNAIHCSYMRNYQESLVSILCPSEGKKYEKIAKQTKQYEKKKFRVFKHLARNRLILNKLEKLRGTNPCFPATLEIPLFWGENSKISVPLIYSSLCKCRRM